MHGSYIRQKMEYGMSRLMVCRNFLSLSEITLLLFSAPIPTLIKFLNILHSHKALPILAATIADSLRRFSKSAPKNLLWSELPALNPHPLEACFWHEPLNLFTSLHIELTPIFLSKRPGLKVAGSSIYTVGSRHHNDALVNAKPSISTNGGLGLLTLIMTAEYCTTASLHLFHL